MVTYILYIYGGGYICVCVCVKNIYTPDIYISIEKLHIYIYIDMLYVTYITSKHMYVYVYRS